MSTEHDGVLSHAVLIGRVTATDVFFYGHSNNRTAQSNEYGFGQYFKDTPAKGTAHIQVVQIR